MVSFAQPTLWDVCAVPVLRASSQRGLSHESRCIFAFPFQYQRNKLREILIRIGSLRPLLAKGNHNCASVTFGKRSICLGADCGTRSILLAKFPFHAYSAEWGAKQLHCPLAYTRCYIVLSSQTQEIIESIHSYSTLKKKNRFPTPRTMRFQNHAEYAQLSSFWGLSYSWADLPLPTSKGV